MLSIAKIKEQLEQANDVERKNLLEEYEKDTRSGVEKLVAKYRKQEQKLKDEITRIQVMKKYELAYGDHQLICGIDEVGRGPLAGPVVAGAVILDKNVDILYLNDSKQVSEAKRNVLYEEIKEKAVAYAIGVVSPADIDDMNILQATYKAMRIAISKLQVKPDLLLNDAVVIPGVDVEQVKIIKGDAKSISIAAASILAKVERDRMMVEYAKLYPEYHFDSNKGYGSAEHIKALKEIGPCPIHRASFITHFTS